MIDKAIKKINPNAKFTVNAEDYNQITWLDGTTPISKEDIEAMIPVVEQELQDAETQKETDASNGKQKLLDLGLSEDEVKAMIGI